MIDNSSSMRLSQTNLLSELPDLHERRSRTCRAGCPNIHVAVVSSDMGAGDGHRSPAVLHDQGDNGVFQSAPRGTCTSTTLRPARRSSPTSAASANYAAPTSRPCSPASPRSATAGCGFEHQFASVLRALGADGKPAPPENQGFLRSDALLAIVMVTERGRLLGARAASTLYDTTANIAALVAASARPRTFRCNEFGHLCDGVRPPRHGAERAGGRHRHAAELHVVRVRRRADAGRRGRRADQGAEGRPASEILVAAITGPATPYQVHWAAPSVADTSCGHGVVSHGRRSRTRARRRTAASPTRPFASRSWRRAFGANGFVSSICDADFAPALQQIATPDRRRCWRRAAAPAARPVGFPAARSPASAARAAVRGGGGGAGGSGGGGAAPAAMRPPTRRRAMSAGSGCGCQTGGAAAGVWASAPRARSSRAWRGGGAGRLPGRA